MTTADKASVVFLVLLLAALGARVEMRVTDLEGEVGRLRSDLSPVLDAGAEVDAHTVPTPNERAAKE
jgi:hypothetical protein